jgi:hypothetical protein
VKEELFRRKELEAKIELDEKRKKVLNFFGCVGPKDNHAMSLKLKHKGTGLWLLKDPRFNEWLRTVKEFFNNITKDSHPHIAHFCLSKEGVYLEFSKVCLTYLNFKDFQRPIPPFDNLSDAFEKGEFYKYAGFNWANYAKKPLD